MECGFQSLTKNKYVIHQEDFVFKFMRAFISSLIVVFFVHQAGATSSNLSESGVALQGYDPVSYFREEAPKQGPLKGDAKFQTKVEDATYRFSSEANKEKFLKNPSKYIPAFGGWCAYAVAENKEKVPVDIKTFMIQDGRLLLFYNKFFTNTRDKWQNSDSKTPADFLKKADSNWPEVKNKEP
jgi:YHS domain-containing protein